MTIAERMKVARQATGLTQKELGERMGVSDASIAQYESGQRNPKVETLQRIADALNVPLDMLRGVAPFNDMGLIQNERDFIVRRLVFNEFIPQPEKAIDDIEYWKLISDNIADIQKTETGAKIGYCLTPPRARREWDEAADLASKAASAPTSDDDLKVALFGGSGEVTDEMWEEAKFAIEFIKEKHKKRKLTEAPPDTADNG